MTAVLWFFYTRFPTIYLHCLKCVVTQGRPPIHPHKKTITECWYLLRHLMNDTGFLLFGNLQYICLI